MPWYSKLFAARLSVVANQKTRDVCVRARRPISSCMHHRKTVDAHNLSIMSLPNEPTIGYSERLKEMALSSYVVPLGGAALLMLASYWIGARDYRCVCALNVALKRSVAVLHGLAYS